MSDAKPLSILIVEDEISNYELLKAMMRKLDVKVYWARNGRNAVKLCEEYRFDIIFMDIKMSGMDGYEATALIRSTDKTTPIIAQTAYARMEDEKTILEKGFNDYISKPIDRIKFLKMIEKYT